MIDEKAPEEIAPERPIPAATTPVETQEEAPVEDTPSSDDKKLIIGSAGNMTVHAAGFVAKERPAVPKNTITILVKYPKDFKGPKFYQDGDKREVSKESADRFVKQGFAKIIKE